MDPSHPDSNMTVEQKFALNEETQDAIRLIESGLGNVQRIAGDNDFYHAPILLLATGFERLMKIILYLQWFEANRRIPLETDLYHRGREGHLVSTLLARVIERCYSIDQATLAPTLRCDYDFLASDATLTRIVGVLSGFGRGRRYHNLDVMFGATGQGASPKADWERLETDLLLAAGLTCEQLIQRSFADLYEEINLALVTSLERFARALARLFTLGPLGPSGRAQTAVIAPFLNLRDEDLGARDY